MRIPSASQYSSVSVSATIPRSSGTAKDDPEEQERRPIAAKAGENDGPGMWTPAGVLRRDRHLAATRLRLDPESQLIQTIQTRTIAMIAIGRSAMSEPQSGVTSRAVRSRNHCQMASSIGRVA